jgi:hypothetical protein
MSINPYAPPKSELGRKVYGPDGRTCPSCFAEVSFRRMYLSLGPQHIRCKACGARIGFDDLAPIGAVGSVLLTIAGLGSWFASSWFAGPRYISWALLFSVSASLLAAPLLAQCRAHRRLRVFR